MKETITNFLKNFKKKILVIKSCDYEHVKRVIESSIFDFNLSAPVEFQKSVFTQNIFEESISFIDFLKELRGQPYTVGIAYLAEVTPEIALSMYYYAPQKLIVISPVLKPDVAVEPFVEVITDRADDMEEVVAEILEKYRQKGREISVDGNVVHALKGLSRVEAEQIVVDSIIETGKVEYGFIISRKKRLFEKDSVLQLVTPPADIDPAVGLEAVKNIVVSSYRSGLGKGTLLLGVAGVGKSLLAQNLAREFPVIRFNISKVYSKYLGETEQRLDAALQRLQQFGEGFVFIDEFEKAMASAAHGQDGGASMRVLGMLLEFMQNREGNLYFLGTANRIEMLPAELLRPGRWDFIFSIPFPPQHVVRKVVEHYSQKYEIPVSQELISEEFITPADIATIYRVAKMLGKTPEQAKIYVKRTRNLYNDVKTYIKALNSMGLNVWELNEQGDYCPVIV